MKPEIINLSTISLAIALSFGTAAPGAAAESGTHQHEGAAGQAIKLDAGKKWTIDAPMREGMTGIRDAIAADRQSVHAGKMSAAKYDALAQKIDNQVAYMVQNCKLPPEADANLHRVLAEIMEGSELIKGRDKKAGRRAGVEKVVVALDAYNRHFDHPGWRGLK